MFGQQKAKQKRTNTDNNEKTKLSEVITTQRKARLLELLKNICFRLTPRKKEVNLRDLQKRKTVWHLKNSKYPFDNRFMDGVLAKWTPLRYN